MKLFLISEDADTCVGMRLAGVESVLVHDSASAENAINKTIADEDVGILFITEGVKNLAPQAVSALAGRKKPILTQIPDSKTTVTSGDIISEYIRTACGISI